MAEHKKSFVLYADMIHQFEHLDDQEAGKLIKIIFDYVNDNNPNIEDKLLKIAFEPIKRQLKRDLIDWRETCEKRSLSGHLGGLKSGESRRLKREANEANALKTKQSEANEADNVNDNDTVTDNVNDTVKNNILSDFEKFWDAMPSKIAKQKCLDKWKKLSDIERQKILSTVKDWAKYKPFETYTHPHPLTYLNQCRWNDELPSMKKYETREMKIGDFYDYEQYISHCKKLKIEPITREQFYAK